MQGSQERPPSKGLGRSGVVGHQGRPRDIRGSFTTPAGVRQAAGAHGVFEQGSIKQVGRRAGGRGWGKGPTHTDSRSKSPGHIYGSGRGTGGRHVNAAPGGHLGFSSRLGHLILSSLYIFFLCPISIPDITPPSSINRPDCKKKNILAKAILRP